MLITVANLQVDPIEFDEHLVAGRIDYGEGVEQRGTLDSSGRFDLIEEHRGPREIVPDIRVRGRLNGRFMVACARCVEPVERPLQAEFDLLYRPAGADASGAEHAISTSETEIGYYNGDGLSLEDVLREQVLLSLPERTLCQVDCKGLCPSCGQNLNTEACTCTTAKADPRWDALSGLRGRIKS